MQLQPVDEGFGLVSHASFAAPTMENGEGCRGKFAPVSLMNEPGQIRLGLSPNDYVVIDGWRTEPNRGVAGWCNETAG